jgi:hypothetical protein
MNTKVSQASAKQSLSLRTCLAKIGIWCNTQKCNYRNNGKLNDERKNKLESIEGWYWEKNQSWDETYEIVEEFVKEKKRLPKKSDEYRDILIGVWCNRQRCNYKNNGKLNDERKNKLEKLEGWYWGEKYSSRACLTISWDENYKIVEEFVKEKKRLPKRSDEYRDILIGVWCNRQRCNYRNNGKLNDERKNKLEKLEGWYWGETYLPWDENYKIVEEFIKEKKRLPKKSDKYRDILIGIWCSNQKNNYRKEEMNEERKFKLEKLEGWYWRKNSVVLV